MRQFVYVVICVLGLCVLLLPYSAIAKTEEEYQQDIRVLQKRNTQLENSLEHVTSDLKNKTQQMKLLQDQVAEMAREGEDGLKEVQETRKAMKQLKKQFKTLLEQQNAEKSQELEAQLSKTLQENQQLVQQITTLAKEKDALQQEMDQLQQAPPDENTEKIQQLEAHATKTLLENQLLEKQLKLVIQEKEHLQQELDELAQAPATTDESGDQQDLITLRTELEKQKRQFKSNLALLAQREQELQEAKAQIKKMATQATPRPENDSAQTELRMKELESTLATVNARLVKYSQENARLKEQLATQSTSISQQSGEQLVALRESMMELNERIEQLTQENARLDSQIKQQQEQHNDALAAKDLEITTLQQEVRSATEQLSAQSMATQHFEEYESKIEQQQALWQAEIVKKDAEISRLEGELRKAADYINSHSSEITSLKQQNADLRSEMKQEQHSYVDLRSQVSQEIESLKTKVQTIDTERTSLRTTLQTVEAERDRLQNNLQGLEQKNQELQQAVTTLQTQLEEKSSVPEAARKRIEELVEEFQAVKIQLDTQNRLVKEHPLLQQEIEALQEQLASLRSKNQLLEKTIEEKSARIESQKAVEQQYRKGIEEVDLKEKLLQQTLAEKAVLEKMIDDGGCTPDMLTTIQEQQLQQQKLEAELKQTRQQIAELSGQQTDTTAVKPLSSAASSQNERDLLQTLFPHGIQTNGTISVLNWSPDKSRFAYLETMDQRQQLWVVNRFAPKPVKITEWQGVSTSPHQFEWAHDNHHFLFATGSPGQYTLYLGNSNRLLGSPIPLFEQHVAFAWSPKQLQFAYFSGTTLIIQNTSQHTLPIEIGHHPGTAGPSLAWSPDGTRIALSIKRDTSFDISLLSFVNNSPVLQALVTSPSDDVQPSWSPDGRYVAFYVHSPQYGTKVAVTPVDQSQAPYIIGHNASLPQAGGPRWLTPAQVVYMGEEQRSASHNLIYRVDIATGQRSSVPLTMLFPQ
ncbi:hypothetical protein CSA56_09525 [candidate division KSB3 bacterium]|uniref:Translation initiation factor beta propellor-like domain-containing protein n=1 Tax=candidate division KSB3 bacterium TaxID=2044937 RepID=A0A2G6KGH9_9BACT|nr:MAG: hypothetical protein CSA56_09525 [candidate division KSB3 bacterium]